MILPAKPEPGSGIILKKWLMQLWAYCRSLQVSGDGKTCTVSRTANGTVISCIVPPPLSAGNTSGGGGTEGEPEYNGYFKIVYCDAEGDIPAKIKIIDGANPTSEICGNTDLGNVQAAEIEYDGAPLYIYLLCTYVPANAVYDFDFAYLPNSNQPPKKSGSAYIFIGSVYRNYKGDLVIRQYAEKGSLGYVNFKNNYLV